MSGIYMPDFLRKICHATGTDVPAAGRPSVGWPSGSLTLLNAAGSLDFLKAPPGNRLEALKGDRAGQYSICINEQWRVCFTWAAGDVLDVEIVDYH